MLGFSFSFFSRCWQFVNKTLVIFYIWFLNTDFILKHIQLFEIYTFPWNKCLCLTCCCWYWQLQNDQPVLKQIPGRPLLTFPVLRSLVELQPFFNTYSCFQSDNVFVTSGENRRMTKSKSTPVGMASASASNFSVDLGPPSKSNRQFIEELVKQDFLEFLSQWKQYMWILQWMLSKLSCLNVDAQ